MILLSAPSSRHLQYLPSRWILEVASRDKIGSLGQGNREVADSTSQMLCKMDYVILVMLLGCYRRAKELSRCMPSTGSWYH